MPLLRSSNPVIRTVRANTYVSDRPVTYSNVAMKTVFLIGILGVSAYLTILYMAQIGIGILIGAILLGFISVIIGTRSVTLSPIFSVIYAICEGVFLGYISAIYAYLAEGIIPTALMTTGIVFVIMLLFYSTGIIKVTQKFASVMVVALISVIIMAFLSIILPFTMTSTIYYLVCGVSALLSALFLLLDFESIKNCVDQGTDAKMGWILSLGLLVTVVWIYVEILRLLLIFGRRN
ncbi:MAG TPA: Bax inhibitor-1/YccA family protein [Bacillota bacterium]|nr:Bax inhibitor-1/YccA family protein [Bacillota bacterium]HPF41889.1 Bax inhibitor-1/YccA family protein [Bacillota bacterium]HPJ85638.1 Bax inhibitor-1/YccA family protein [Bacillota bacterium]HPQ61410.1 Bax inhibitor-1/YccA family protein [Bacillota bacterium]HRX91298.1 Bax inhibitor-1/YccA family protein [Candidatus Izemoplasmatales bacterium]